jgi:hypothetical protein
MVYTVIYVGKGNGIGAGLLVKASASQDDVIKRTSMDLSHWNINEDQ